MESYKQEIARKRRYAKVFWFIVVLFATFLYFFFQGYYPNIQFGLEEISGSGKVNSGESLIKAFGIVNVKTFPTDTLVTLNTEGYGNNEKKMVNYGDYTMTFARDGYLPTRATFRIEKEKPFFIEEIHMLPKPRYQSLSGSRITDFMKTNDDIWLATASGTIYALDGSFSGKVAVMSGSYRHIGDGLVLSGRTLIRYDGQDAVWIPVVYPKWNTLIQRCQEPIVVEGILSCPKTKEAITQNGYILTGVLRVDRTTVVQDDTLYFHEQGTLSDPISLSGHTIPEGTIFFQDTDSAYMLPLHATGATSLTESGLTLTLPLQDIQHIETVGRYHVVIGSHSGAHSLWIGERSYDSSGSILEFPQIPLDQLRIREINGNLWIKTQNALLFVYRGGTKVEWIIDGQIVAWSDIVALYRKDGVLWKATWTPDRGSP